MKLYRGLSVLFLLYALLPTCVETTHAAEEALPPVEAGKARLVFLRSREGFFGRDSLQRIGILLDRTPLTTLPQASYVVASVDPGNHLIWIWKAKAELGLRLEANQTYALDLGQTGVTAGQVTQYTAKWTLLDDPSLLGELIRDRKLAPARQDASSLQEVAQGSKLEDQYQKALKRSKGVVVERAAAPDVVLPRSFEKVWYRSGEKGVSLVSHSGTGALLVSESAISYDAGDYRLELPAAALRELHWGRMRGDSSNDWAILSFERDGRHETVGFKDGSKLGWGKDTKAMYDCLQRVLQIAGGGKRGETEEN